MSYIDHAKREFLAAGYKPVDECEDGPNKWIQENVFELLDVLAKQGHSGSSIGHVLNMFGTLANFKPLVPLTGNADEWIERQDGTKQNSRYSKLFMRNGVSYVIDRFVFWHWAERSLAEDEDGYPGTHRYKLYFGSSYGVTLVSFPYMPEEPEYVEVDCFEVNKTTGDREPGSGWWETIYPQHIIDNRAAFDAAMAG